MSEQANPTPLTNLTAELSSKLPRFDWPLIGWVLGILTLTYFLFSPVIARENVQRVKSNMDDANTAHSSKLMRLENEQNGQSKAETERKRWEKERLQLEDDLEQAASRNSKAKYWQAHGLMVGCALTLFTSLAVLGTPRPTYLKRIVTLTLGLQVAVTILAAVPSGCGSVSVSYNPNDATQFRTDTRP